ncbi:uncharacterized protein [Rutidosis leptorrhynchoides]|uniref:uncharacterized protein n=1 Tax=Rutidosis leptorrhynchoides TaxID=125765 RepID=UPI003A99765F
MTTDTNRIYPAISVNNIKKFIPIPLEMKNSRYGTWAELFKIHCRAFQVIDHIIPPTSVDTGNSSTTQQSTPPPTRPESWSRLDAIVTQWIYGTVSTEILLTIMKPDQTSEQTWDPVKSIFQDNEQSRAIHLHHQFSTIRQENFSDMSSYCQELKNIVDQLNSVGGDIKDENLVLQMIAGLSDSYRTIGTMLAHTKPTPSFFDARSMIILEES